MDLPGLRAARVGPARIPGRRQRDSSPPPLVHLPWNALLLDQRQRIRILKIAISLIPCSVFMPTRPNKIPNNPPKKNSKHPTADCFAREDERGCRGYTEWGFMSTTADKSIAIQYSGVREHRQFPMVGPRPRARGRSSSFARLPIGIRGSSPLSIPRPDVRDRFRVVGPARGHARFSRSANQCMCGFRHAIPRARLPGASPAPRGRCLRPRPGALLLKAWSACLGCPSAIHRSINPHGSESFYEALKCVCVGGCPPRDSLSPASGRAAGPSRLDRGRTTLM